MKFDFFFFSFFHDVVWCPGLSKIFGYGRRLWPTVQLGNLWFYTQYVRNSTIVYLVKMEWNMYLKLEFLGIRLLWCQIVHFHEKFKLKKYLYQFKKIFTFQGAKSGYCHGQFRTFGGLLFHCGKVPFIHYVSTFRGEGDLPTLSFQHS